MFMTKSLCMLGLAGLLMAGCQTPHRTSVDLGDAKPLTTAITNKLDPALLQPRTDLFVLGPGDQLEIEIIGGPATRATTKVGIDGKIYFSLLPGIDVWGLTLDQARQKIETELGKYVNMTRAAVSLREVNSKYVWLLGRMSRPGIYPMPGPMTLLEALAVAGGTAKSTSTVTTSDLADLRHSFVMRQGKSIPVDFAALLQEGDMSQNIYLQPDDFVFIPSTISQEVYVLGAVVKPTTVSYTDPMTLMAAISAANGPAPEAYLSHVAIVRGSLTKPTLTEVDFGAVMHGRAPNVKLEPGDIVYVPLSPYRFVTEYADLILTTFVRAWSANEGVRVMVGGGNNVNVNVPLGGQ